MAKGTLIFFHKREERGQSSMENFSNYSSIKDTWRSYSMTGCLSHTGMTRRGRLGSLPGDICNLFEDTIIKQSAML